MVLNGQPVRALIDTGFDQLCISKAYALAHRLPLTPWANATGFGGDTAYFTTPDVSLDVGALHTSKPGGVTVVDVGSITGAGLDSFDVVIGLPMLGVFEWQVDWDHHRFRMMKSGSIPMPGGIPIRVGPRNSRLVTDVVIEGRAVSPTMIDTGSDDDVSLTPATAAAVGFEALTDMEAVGAGGSAVQPVGRVADLAIGPHVVRGAYASVGGAAWGSGIAALLGMGMLRSFNMTVDLAAGRMLLDKRRDTPSARPKSTSGVQGPYRGGRLVVTHVMSNSPAAAGGFKAGDEICAVDGEPMSQGIIDRHWGRAAPGTRYELRLCDGRTRMIVLRSFY